MTKYNGFEADVVSFPTESSVDVFASGVNMAVTGYDPRDLDFGDLEGVLPLVNNHLVIDGVEILWGVAPDGWVEALVDAPLIEEKHIRAVLSQLS